MAKPDKKIVGIGPALTYFLDRFLGPDYKVDVRVGEPTTNDTLTSRQIAVTISQRCPPGRSSA